MDKNRLIKKLESQDLVVRDFKIAYYVFRSNGIVPVSIEEFITNYEVYQHEGYADFLDSFLDNPVSVDSFRINYRRHK